MICKYLFRHDQEFEGLDAGIRFIEKFFYRLVGIVICFILWHWIGLIILARPEYAAFAGFLPLAAGKALFALILTPDFWHAVAMSLRRVAVGIAIAATIGLPAGLLIGFYRCLRLITYTPMQFLRMISPLAWMPIALLLYQGFESAIHFLIAMATIWPIIINTILGVVRVNPRWLSMARNQGASDRQLIMLIVLPASTPYIMTSLRLALGVAWTIIVPVEFLGVSSGLGYLINDARDTLEYDRLMAVVLAIGAVGFLLDGLLKAVQRFFRWE